MTKDFGLPDASFYAGILVASFSLSEAAFSMLWGHLSDRVGRKPVLLFGCFGTIVSLMMVGLSSNFTVALVGRVLGGALNGNIGRTILSLHPCLARLTQPRSHSNHGG